MRLRFRKDRTADTDPGTATATEAPASPEELAREIEATRERLAAGPDSELERRLLRLRHRLGLARRREQTPGPMVEPETDGFVAGELPEIGPDELSAAKVRGAILTSGCVVVRGLVPREQALDLARGIDEAIGAWVARDAGEEVDPGLFEEFVPDEGDAIERGWVNSAGGIWTADSPRMTHRVTEMFERSGLSALAHEYLGEPPLLSLQKGTLRKVPPTAGRGWHQDGAFLGDVKALNTWVALSRCGDEAPGMDLIPKRIEEIVPTGTEGATFDWSVSEQLARETAGETPIVRPIFEPGDVVLFDELCLHTTAAEPSMPNHRYAIETWFFGPSAYPEEYVPIAP